MRSDDHTPTARPLAEAWLRQRIGLDPESIGSNSIARAVDGRIRACGVADEARYISRLAHDTEESQRLIDDIVVLESWFFRDSAVFEFLRRFAVALAAAPGRPPIRILCVPCASGEEPYSVAIALLEAGLAARRFHIDAYDVSTAALTRAHEGVYSNNAFRAHDSALLQRWFHPDGARHALDEAVRKRVQFGHGNLLEDSFLAGSEPYDVVFCRNLLIYLATEARIAAERTLERLVAPEGLLVLGASEPATLRGNWIPAAETAAFTLRRGTASAAILQPSSPGAFSPVPSAAAPMARSAPVATDAAPRALVATIPPAAPPPAADLLREADRLAARGRRGEAVAACERHLQVFGPNADAFFLLGMLHHANDDPDRAVAFLEKTLYLAPEHHEALLTLAILADRRGNAPQATRYRRAADRVRGRREARS